MATHEHTAKCWERYTPCGEHHAHSYSCGGGELAPSCPQYQEQRGWKVNSAARDVVKLLDNRFGRVRNRDLKLAVLEKAKKLL